MTVAAEIATVSVTLSRAHKIAERIKAGMTERFNEAKTGAAIRNIQSNQIVQHSAQMEQAGRKALATLVEAGRWSAALVAVRQQIAEANAPRVSGLLAEMEAANRMLAVYKEILGSQDETAPAAGDTLLALQPNMTAPVSYMTVRALSDSSLAHLRSCISELQRQAFALSDELAEANAARVMLKLPADIASHVGG